MPTLLDLTPEQTKHLESLRSHKERENYIEILNLEKQMSQPAQVEATPEAEAEVQPSVETETVEPTPVETESTEEVETAPEYSLEYFKERAQKAREEAERAEKRRRDAESHLTPVMQEAAELRKERESLQAQIEDLKRLVLERAKSNESSFDPEFENTYDEVAAYVKKAFGSLRDELDSRLRVIEEKAKQYTENATQSHEMARRQAHFNEVVARHSDAADYFDQNKLGPAFVEWSNTQPPVIQSIVRDPLSHTPDDVAFAITSFKNLISPKKPLAKKPSLGDRAAMAKPATSLTLPDKANDEIFPSSFTEADFTELLNKINREHQRKSPEKINDLMDAQIAKWDRTLRHRLKNQ